MNVIDWRPFLVDGKPFTLSIVPDDDESTDDADCYTDADIEAFHDGDWSFVGLIVRDESGREASLWGVHYGISAEWTMGIEDYLTDDYFAHSLACEVMGS